MEALRGTAVASSIKRQPTVGISYSIMVCFYSVMWTSEVAYFEVLVIFRLVKHSFICPLIKTPQFLLNS